MGKLLGFEYLNDTSSNRSRFIQMPLFLYEDENFSKMNNESKILYSFFLNRVSLSEKNKDAYSDDNGNLFVVFSQDKMCSIINRSKNSITKYTNELVSHGLIEIKSGQGNNHMIYVKKPIFDENINDNDIVENESPEEQESQNHKNCDSRITDSTISESQNPESQNLSLIYNKTPFNHNEEIYHDECKNSKLINMQEAIDRKNALRENIAEKRISAEERLDQCKKRYEQLKTKYMDKIDYERLQSELDSADMQIVDMIIEIMVKKTMSDKSSIKISTELHEKSEVIERFESFDYDTVKYVIESLNNTNTHIKYPDNYLLKTIYNAPATVKIYLKQKNKKNEAITRTYNKPDFRQTDMSSDLDEIEDLYMSQV